ncbi:hypothetical protein FZEAL_1992 [Fusarium zealandicum]|uniref:MARVEL domain-containing protein n=1 Tax=Fusarium zealandicum TaxID=1053134 RepID=A0A8H4USE5_9HYPO|nr:hypothetical protein FZEAL_1992 [Fusarium zealandicum]
MKFEFDPDMVPNLKVGLHSFQIILSFVAWCLEIGVLNGKKALVTGKNGWTFAVCFLSVPAWIFLIMTPRWNRTRKFAQPHAMLAVDCLMCIIWLSAFATQASYNAEGSCKDRCNISKGIVGCGVLVTYVPYLPPTASRLRLPPTYQRSSTNMFRSILFAGSSFVSAYTLKYYTFHGNLPGYDNRQIRSGDNIDPDKAAFSMAPHDDEAYERVNMDDNEPTGNPYGGGYNNSSYNSTSRYGEANPYGADDDDGSRYGSMPPRNNTLFENDTEYHSGGAPPSMPANYANPPAGLGYEDQPAQFPTGNYNRTH